MLERKAEDPRVFYYFFKAAKLPTGFWREAVPARSPRVTTSLLDFPLAVCLTSDHSEAEKSEPGSPRLQEDNCWPVLDQLALDLPLDCPLRLFVVMFVCLCVGLSSLPLPLPLLVCLSVFSARPCPFSAVLVLCEFPHRTRPAPTRRPGQTQWQQQPGGAQSLRAVVGKPVFLKRMWTGSLFREAASGRGSCFRAVLASPADTGRAGSVSPSDKLTWPRTLFLGSKGTSHLIEVSVYLSNHLNPKPETLHPKP